MTAVYVNYFEVNELQTKVMRFVDWWVREKKTPTPHQEIVKELLKDNIPDYSVKQAIKTLIKNGYLRRAYTVSNKTYYVQLRRI